MHLWHPECAGIPLPPPPTTAHNISRLIWNLLRRILQILPAMSLQLLLPLRQPARQRPPGIPFHRRHHALPRRGLLRQRLPIPQSRSILHAAPIAPKHFPTPYPPLIFWKQLRHSTGLPCVGLNGTVVSAPHSEHVVRVSGRTLDPVARFALHTLQRFGSFVNCFSWKNSCSPAVNTNSFPQSTHFKLRSVNSISGFPEFTRRKPRRLQGPIRSSGTNLHGHDGARAKGIVFGVQSATKPHGQPKRPAQNGEEQCRLLLRFTTGKTQQTFPEFRPLHHTPLVGGGCLLLCLSLAGQELILFLARLLAIPLACQCFLHALLLTGLQVVGVTFDFLDDVFLLYLPLKPAESILKRLAFLYANLCQINTPPILPKWLFPAYGILRFSANCIPVFSSPFPPCTGQPPSPLRYTGASVTTPAPNFVQENPP